MKYERLTSTYTTGDREKISGCINPITYAVNVSETIFRLAELEDKIECGELISTVQDERSEQEIAFFVKHNAEVRKQAVKEFAERVKMAFYYEFDELIPSTMADKIDEIVKEVLNEHEL